MCVQYLNGQSGVLDLLHGEIPSAVAPAPAPSPAPPPLPSPPPQGQGSATVRRPRILALPRSAPERNASLPGVEY